MKLIHKCSRSATGKKRATSQEEPIERYNSKRARQDSQQQVFRDHRTPASEEISSFSSTSRVSSEDSLQTLGEPRIEDQTSYSNRVKSVQSLPPSHFVVVDTRQVRFEEGNPMTTNSSAKADSGRAECRKAEQQLKMLGKSPLLQGNLSKRVIERTTSASSTSNSNRTDSNEVRIPVEPPLRLQDRKAFSRWYGWVALLGAVLFLGGPERWSPLVDHLSFSRSNLQRSQSRAQTFYVPGYGFSGFWYILGRLQSIPDPHIQKEYYCYSAGCLGVVATLQNRSMMDIHQEAVRIQNQWKSGEIGRYDVVEHFVSWLLLPSANHSAEEGSSVNPSMLARLKVITSAPGSAWGIRPVVRTPTSIDELREMLIQTTWLPFATGGAVWHARGHNDGAFTWPFHPSCDFSIGLTNANIQSSLDLILNVVNVNLSRRKVEEFWSLGVANGIS